MKKLSKYTQYNFAHLVTGEAQCNEIIIPSNSILLAISALKTSISEIREHNDCLLTPDQLEILYVNKLPLPTGKYNRNDILHCKNKNNDENITYKEAIRRNYLENNTNHQSVQNQQQKTDWILIDSEPSYNTFSDIDEIPEETSPVPVTDGSKASLHKNYLKPKFVVKPSKSTHGANTDSEQEGNDHPDEVQYFPKRSTVINMGLNSQSYAKNKFDDELLD